LPVIREMNEELYVCCVLVGVKRYCDLRLRGAVGYVC